MENLYLGCLLIHLTILSSWQSKSLNNANFVILLDFRRINFLSVESFLENTRWFRFRISHINNFWSTKDWKKTYKKSIVLNWTTFKYVSFVTYLKQINLQPANSSGLFFFLHQTPQWKVSWSPIWLVLFLDSVVLY